MYRATRTTLKQKVVNLENQLKQAIVFNRITITLALVIGFVLGKLS
jgi:hypothetical protein